MCGFAGVFRRAAGGSGSELASIAARMATTLAHRGPDDAHCVADVSAGIALGFRRLSIIDVSLDGRQPMASHDGRFLIVYNGEIYNHRALRDTLDRETSSAWRGHSDTEVLLECIARHGVDGAIARLNGMFAFAVWDREQRELWLARDRFGEKPLYYARLGDDLVFASELRALAEHPAWRPRLDHTALAMFLRLGFIPGARTAFESVHKLPAAHVLRIRADDTLSAPVCYWDPWQRALEGRDRSAVECPSQMLEELQALIDDAVASRTISDRPLGAFLSGGVDSTTVVGAMSRMDRDVRTFCIGFDDPRYDESPHAERIAEHLNARHTTVRVGNAECLAAVDDLVDVYDEPFADVSQIPTLLLCRITREHVTVSLSGDGGDELFGGYPRYRDVPARFARVDATAAWYRGLARSLLRLAGRAPGGWARKLGRAMSDFSHCSLEALYRSRVSQWPAVAITSPAEARARWPVSAQRVPAPLRLMLDDAGRYLVDDLQVKMDRASMSVGLEARAPLLDHRIAELAWRLPATLTSDAPGKLALRTLLDARVPQSLWSRPKQGFEPPIGQWLRGPLRERAEHHFSERSLSRLGLIDPRHVRARWKEHLAGRNRAHALWTVYMLGAWLDGPLGAPARAM